MLSSDDTGDAWSEDEFYDCESDLEYSESEVLSSLEWDPLSKSADSGSSSRKWAGRLHTALRRFIDLLILLPLYCMSQYVSSLYSTFNGWIYLVSRAMLLVPFRKYTLVRLMRFRLYSSP